jgi:hypothetical protein
MDLKILKKQIDDESVLQTAREIAVKTKVSTDRFGICQFCHETMADRLEIRSYDVCEVELRCNNCQHHYGLHHEKGVVDAEEVLSYL